LEEIKRFEKALRLVERYEGYLFRRATGISLIICGIVFPFTAFLVFNSRTIASLLNMSVQAFLLFIPPIIILTGIAAIVFLFTSAHVVTSKMRKESMWKDAPHMVLMFLVWFIPFYLTNYVPETYSTLSWLWAGACASLLSYLLMRKDPVEGKYTELLVIGAFCTISSIPLLFVKDQQLVIAATFLIFTLSFIAGGIYSILDASKLLGIGEK